jgi:hypothetical protein
MAALQEVERAHGVGGEVTPAAPHRNSRASKTTIEQLRARTEPDAWVGASATVAEASFAASTKFPAHDLIFFVMLCVLFASCIEITAVSTSMGLSMPFLCRSRVLVPSFAIRRIVFSPTPWFR